MSTGAVLEKESTFVNLLKSLVGFGGSSRREDPSDPSAVAAAKKGFEQQYRIAADRLWMIKKLRGADTDRIIQSAIERLDEMLRGARADVDSALDATVVREVTARFSQFETVAKQTEDRAREVERACKADLEAMPRYSAALEAATKARESIAGLPGARTQLVAIELLLTRGRAAIADDGRIRRGYETGLEILLGHTALLEEAQRVSSDYMAREIDREVRDARISAETKIGAHRRVAPEFQTKLYEQQLAAAVEASREDKAKALEDIARIATIAEDEVRKLNELKDAALECLVGVEERLEQFRTDGVDESAYARIQQDMHRARDVDLAAREYVQAKETLDNCVKAADSLTKALTEEAAVWREKKTRLGEIQQRCQELSGWPPLMGVAIRLAGDARDLIKKVHADHNIDDGLMAYNVIESRLEQLEHDAASKVPEGEDLNAFAEARKQAGIEVNASRDLVAFVELERAMEGVVDKSGNILRKECDRCELAWQQFISNPVADPSDPNVLTTLSKRKAATIETYQEINRRISELLGDENALPQFIEKAKQADEERAKTQRPQKISLLLSRLRDFQVDVDADVEAYDALIDPDSMPETPKRKEDLLKNLESRLQEKLKQVQQEHSERQRMAHETIKTIDKALKKFESSNPAFKDYVRQLKAQSEDLKTLVDSGDHYLYQQAVKESEDLVRKMEAIDPERRKRDDKTYEDVEKKLTELSNALGKKNLIKKRLPDTYEKLYRDLQDAIAVAKRSSPPVGLAALATLEGPITQASTLAASEDQVYQQFKTKKKAVENRWTEIMKLTETWWTDRTKAFEANLTSRLAQAATTAGQEGQINSAITELGILEQELNAIAGAADPRVALQDADTKAAQQQRLIADMARQFNAALQTYQDTTLPGLRTIMKGVSDKDEDQIDSLEKVGKQASTIVEPYLNIISKWPHKSLSANAAPPLDAAAADFGKAQKMLADATRTAQRLSGDPVGTNVKVSGDLKKIAEDWTKRANTYANAINTMAEAVKSALEAEDGEELRAAVTTASSDLKAVAGHFRPEAFANPLGTLCDESSVEKQRLAAREAVLRRVRQYVQDLLNDPVMIKINDAKNPFRNINNETSMLRAALKKMELEVLVGI